ncbi:helix-turn-helix domain-containing protein [Chryseobacterium indologenes]|nr:helix-turn-helix domain-containing protein [Chryseobacterium indologenes]
MNKDQFYLKKGFQDLEISMRQIASDMNVSQVYVSNILNGKKRIGSRTALKLAELYGLNINWLLTGEGSMFDNTDESKIHSLNRTKEDVLNNLNRIKINRKVNLTSEGHEIFDHDLAEATQFIIPIKGQAGLKKAFFAPDEYIDQNFAKEIIHVKRSERGVYHKIEVDGHSMPGVLDPGDWARCEDIPKLFWLDKGTFKVNKVYCLFHRTKGILFKRISKISLDTITLSSDNTDKVEYPDETFDLMEFSKILIVRKVEKDL